MTDQWKLAGSLFLLAGLNHLSCGSFGNAAMLYLREQSAEAETPCLQPVSSTCEDIPVQVTAFSRWEKELPKLVADDRFKAVSSMRDRKAAFEDHCRNMSEQKKRVKAANGQAESLDSEEAKSSFRSLMEEASARVPDGMLLILFPLVDGESSECLCGCCRLSLYSQGLAQHAWHDNLAITQKPCLTL